MRLPYLRAAAPDVIATAKAQRWDPAEVLRVLITEEVIGRDAATRRVMRGRAGLMVMSMTLGRRGSPVFLPRGEPVLRPVG